MGNLIYEISLTRCSLILRTNECGKRIETAAKEREFLRKCSQFNMAESLAESLLMKRSQECNSHANCAMYKNLRTFYQIVQCLI